MGTKEVLLSVRFDIDGISQFTFEIMDLEKWKTMESLIKRFHWIQYPVSLPIESSMNAIGEDSTLTSKEVLDLIKMETDSKIIAAFRLFRKGDSLSTDCNLFDIIEETLENLDMEEEREREEEEKQKKEEEERERKDMGERKKRGEKIRLLREKGTYDPITFIEEERMARLEDRIAKEEQLRFERKELQKKMKEEGTYNEADEEEDDYLVRLEKRKVKMEEFVKKMREDGRSKKEFAGEDPSMSLEDRTVRKAERRVKMEEFLKKLRAENEIDS